MHIPTIQTFSDGRAVVTWSDGRRSEGHIVNVSMEHGHGAIGPSHKLRFELACFDPIVSEEASTIKAAADEANERARKKRESEREKEERKAREEEERNRPIRDFANALESL